MRKPKPKTLSPTLSRKKATPVADASLLEVVEMIQAARQQAFQAVNTTLMDLYWRLGEYISRKLATAAWGEGVVKQLAA